MTFTPSSTAGREGQIKWKGMTIAWDKALSGSDPVIMRHVKASMLELPDEMGAALIMPARRIRAMKRISSHVVQRTTILSNQIVDIKGNHA